MEMVLTQGMIAQVDDEDYKYLKLFKWYAKKSKVSWYAVRMERSCSYSMRGSKTRPKDKRKTIRMHNVIMKPGDGIVHHRDGDGLNNRRSNLEVVDLQQNNQYAVDKRERAKDDIPF